MKRALAERAKQSGLPNGVATASVPAMQDKSLSRALPDISSPSVSAPPVSNISNPITNGDPSALHITGEDEPSQKSSLLQQQNLNKVVIPKQEETANAVSSMDHVSSTSKPERSPRPSPSPRPKKRLRDSSADKYKQLQEEDEDDSSASAFYLKHQNRALASELRSVKYQLSRLEREREFRRTQCLEAVNSVNSLRSIWGQLESSLGKVKSATTSVAMSDRTTDTTPLSTGSGTSVEMIGAFMESLAELGISSRSKIRGAEDVGEEINNIARSENAMDDDGDTMNSATAEAVELKEEELTTTHLANITENIAERATVLQSWIWSLLQKLDSVSQMNGQILHPPTASELQERITRMEAENITLQQRIQELARSREEIVESDRRVRRGLYRLAAGRVQLKEVLKAVASADEDKEAAAAWMEAGSLAVSGTPGTNAMPAMADANSNNDPEQSDQSKEPAVSTQELSELRKQVTELHEVAAARDEQIKQLLSEREEHLRRINTLVIKESNPLDKEVSSEDIQQSNMYLELSAELAAKERKLQELEDKTQRVKEEWSTALANAEFSKRAMEDLQAKHMKRWSDLAQESPDIGPADESGETTGITQAEEIVTLQHKLTQALENVRQAASTRKTLDEAMAMNDTLQTKVDELKSKYNALQAEKAAPAANSVDPNNDESSGGNNGAASSNRTKGVDSSSADKNDRSAEKLHRDYKRAKKELGAAIASKEAAKAKLERAEKEKESLNQQNLRLLKQSTEKDEINAKSLSTILHLKQLTEQVSKEKENLEQQVKSAEQLALAARLASNARERVTEEFEKERKRLEEQVKEWEQKCNDLAREKALVETRLSQEKARMTKLVGDAQKAKERCEELASESTKLQEEKQKMMESLAVAQREATEASNLSQRLAESKGGGLVAGFTAEQLNTQVTVLKGRLACPVCNVRDKKCILLRCRHMFCKQCVDENIKNRSRKCPACGGRFDTKDVADVWL